MDASRCRERSRAGGEHKRDCAEQEESEEGRGGKKAAEGVTGRHRDSMAGDADGAPAAGWRLGEREEIGGVAGEEKLRQLVKEVGVAGWLKKEDKVEAEVWPMGGDGAGDREGGGEFGDVGVLPDEEDAVKVGAALHVSATALVSASTGEGFRDLRTGKKLVW